MKRPRWCRTLRGDAPAGGEGQGNAHLQHLAVSDRRVVAEEVLAAVVGLDEAEALGVPPHRHAGRLAVARVVTLALPIYVTHWTAVLLPTSVQLDCPLTVR